VDAEEAQDPKDQLYPGDAARIAIFLPGRRGAAFDAIFYLPFLFHPDDPGAQARHVRAALEKVLDPVPPAAR
jgi:hypothetical protein